MVMLSDLHPASFRGAKFLVPRDTAEEGRNSIRHLYPDSSVSYVEDNGYLPPEFKLTCVLHGRNVLSQFNSLRSALNRPGPGTLHHPYYGAQFCAVKGPYRVEREDSDSGVIKLEVTFLVTGPAVFPGKFGSIAAQVTGLSSAFVTSLFTKFVSDYGDPIFSNVTLQAIATEAQGIAGMFLDSLGSVATVQTAATHLYDNPERYVQDGPQFGAELVTMFRGGFEDLAQTYSGQDITTAMAGVARRADQTAAAAAALPLNTVDYQVRAVRLFTFSIFVRLACLSSMCEALAGTTFATAEQVHAAEDQLLALYASIPLDSLSYDTAQGIAEVVAAAMSVLRELELQLPNIELLPIHEFPASVLGYMLYESETRNQNLVDFNPEQNPLLFDPSAYVLTGS